MNGWAALGLGAILLYAAYALAVRALAWTG